MCRSPRSARQHALLHRYVLDAHMVLQLLILTRSSGYFFGINATSITLFSSSTKSTVASPLDNVASLG